MRVKTILGQHFLKSITVLLVILLVGCQSLSSRNASTKNIDCVDSLKTFFLRTKAAVGHIMISESSFADRGIVMVVSSNEDTLVNQRVFFAPSYATCHKSFEIKTPFERGIGELNTALPAAQNLGPSLPSNRIDGIRFRYYKWKRLGTTNTIETLKAIDMNNPHDSDLEEAKPYVELVDAFYHTVEQTSYDQN